ncbi:MAG: hypothetical protein V3V00_08540 [Saprospiraceae bacterium]
MKISEFLGTIHQRDSLLFRSGLFTLIVGVLLLFPMAIDDRLIMGINPWIKPIKFCLSITIFVWTVAWLLEYFPKTLLWRKIISKTVFVTMLIEILIIIIQAGRGTTSHYNFTTQLNGALFGIMGIMIALVTLAIMGLFFLFIFKKVNLDRVYLNAIRIGIAIFLLASYVGSIMISNEAHTVGVKDGGPGLPFVNWSTIGGDLRIAHFLGLHAIQIFPLFAYWMIKKTGIKMKERMVALLIFTILFLSVLAFIFFQAQEGKPLL